MRPSLSVFFLGVSLTMALAFQPAVAQPLTVLELFQSQGCSSCPPAIANVNALADRPDILALTFAVTYWDRLGWKDTFARAEFTQRQYDYARGLGHANVYTPQVVIGGRTDLTGTVRPELLAAIAHAPAAQASLLSQSSAGVSVAAGPAPSGGADLWLVRYDPRIQNVAIGAGENSGVTIAHRNVVRELVRLGGWSGAPQKFVLPGGGDPAWRAAILLQSKNGGPILSALKLAPQWQAPPPPPP
jgi:hypothetical protein